MTRRALVCTLDHGEDIPENHPYKNDPIKMIMEDRSKYVAAALTIARAYLHTKDKINIPHPIASYQDWARFAREPLIWLGAGDPVSGMDKAREDDPKRNAAATFFEQWATLPELKPLDKPRKVFEFVKLANEGGGFEQWIPKYDELYYALIEQCANNNGRVDPVKMGYWMRSLKGHVHAGYRLEVSNVSNHGNSWILKPFKKGD
jgi:hypothetical protein